ncbi:alpha-amylase family glycosyl hydrolase [Peristeroidobacter soli]|uniref:alpha-amylase family glycosyl hydrolase n=1 Tax=Peristeroidobacter soli TaxID=2497877 RepID=UPI00101D5B6B|nr:alpha-amylase family glycosyl hydrolase [Peristeroidobacter soli]
MLQIDRPRSCPGLFFGVFAALVALGIHAEDVTRTPTSRLPATPEWAKDLVIYEIATKSFTSPSGPESGNFESLKARLAYLQDLGITAIWLSGHSLSDPHHFYNVWTQYATIEPDKLDPSLGMPEQFKAMIDEAHRRGIKIFLDAITHGVMPESPLIKRHPHWFRGSSFGMIDYDWYGGHTDLDDWWVQVWTDYVVRYGVDGFRLDVDIYRPDLWSRIRKNAAAAGRPIVLFPEVGRVISGVTDFKQGDARATDLADDVSTFYSQKFGKAGSYRVEIQFADGGKSTGTTEESDDLQVRLNGLADEVSPRMDFFVPTDEVADVQLRVTSVSGAPRKDQASTRPIRDIIVTRKGDGAQWTLSGVNILGNFAGNPIPIRTGAMIVDGWLPDFKLNLRTLGDGLSSVLLSTHDNGWDGFSLDQNPYVAQGSRALFGYAFLFTPMIPIFMAGEEFDAKFHALPTLSPNLYGGKSPGKGRWLYGSMLDWSELTQSHHRDMLDDVSKMLAIRKQERAVLAPWMRSDLEPQLMAVPHISSIDVPVPYMRWKEDTAIIVMANRDTKSEALLQLKVPVDRLGDTPGAKYRVTDLWRGTEPRMYSRQELANFPYTVKPDKTPGGGLGILKIEVTPPEDGT